MLSKCGALCYNLAMASKKLFGKVNIHYGKVSLILLGVFVVLLASDLILKAAEEAYDWQFTVIPGLIWVEHGHRNPGAAFSFLANAEWGQAFLVAFSFVMFAALVIVFLLLPERMVLLKLAIAMVASGALGNLVDRIAFSEVRDFVWVNMFFSTACCNFADFWIVFGVIVGIIDMLFFNEYSIFPLTEKAKAAQRAHEEGKNKGELNAAAELPESSDDDKGAYSPNSENGAGNGADNSPSADDVGSDKDDGRAGE